MKRESEDNKIRISEQEAKLRLESSPLEKVSFQLSRVLNQIKDQTTKESY